MFFNMVAMCNWANLLNSNKPYTILAYNEILLVILFPKVLHILLVHGFAYVSYGAHLERKKEKRNVSPKDGFFSPICARTLNKIVGEVAE